MNVTHITINNFFNNTEEPSSKCSNPFNFISGLDILTGGERTAQVSKEESSYVWQVLPSQELHEYEEYLMQIFGWLKHETVEGTYWYFT